MRGRVAGCFKVLLGLQINGAVESPGCYALRMRTVAIVGRPNVGKSALFNRLAGRKISIVHDMPGVTRDRIVARCALGRAPFQIVDTGGIGADVDVEFTDQVRAEVDIALESSDLLVFVVDGQSGLTPTDMDLARRMHKVSKPLILVVNKIDHDKHQSLPAEFTRLGFSPVIPVSAEHGLGIGVLVDRIDALLPSADASEEAREGKPLQIAILGRPNVGKSSLTNAILEDERTLVSPISGTTRDSVDIPYRRGDQYYTLIDTAGIRPKAKRADSVEVFSVMRSEKSLERADLCMLVIDASQGVSSQDKRIGGKIQEAGKPCIVVINKWDLIQERTQDKEGLREVLNEIREELFFLSYAPLVLLSAKTGLSMERLFKRVEGVREASSRRIGTGVLNRLMATAMTNHPVSLKSGRRFKVLYATQPEPRGNSAIPVPELVLFCNEKALLDDSYRRFLEARIREVEPWDGLPIKIFFRERGPRTPGSGTRRKNPGFEMPRTEDGGSNAESAPRVGKRGASQAAQPRRGAGVREKSPRK
jgi:GTP-binding protein